MLLLWEGRRRKEMRNRSIAFCSWLGATSQGLTQWMKIGGNITGSETERGDGVTMVRDVSQGN